MNSKQSVWQLHEAKARFSELFRRVRTEGPQRVVKQGGEAVVILSAEEFERASGHAEQPASLVEFFVPPRPAAAGLIWHQSAIRSGSSSGSEDVRFSARYQR